MSQMAVKNLQGLNDILDAEKLNYQKYCSYLPQIQDSELKNLVSDLISSTQEHYNTVFKYLKSHKG